MGLSDFLFIDWVIGLFIYRLGYLTFYLLMSVNYSYVLDMKPLSRIHIVNVFSYPVGCLFTLLIVPSDKWKFLIFLNVIIKYANLSVFSFVVSGFVGSSLEMFAYSKAMLVSKSFRSEMHLELTLVYGVTYESRYVFSFLLRYPVVPAPMTE